MRWQVTWPSRPGKFTTKIISGEEERDLYREIDRLGITSCEIRLLMEGKFDAAGAG